MTGASDAWCSPQEIADPLAEFIGGPVDVDPCSNDRSVILAHVKYYSGGLILPWMRDTRQGTVYQNDPYSQAATWTAKMLYEIRLGHVTELVRLSMMSTSTEWWSDMCNKPRRNPRVLGLKRLYFRPDPDFVSKAAPKTKKSNDRMTCRFEPALTYIGPREKQFTKAFAHLTRWATWGR